MKDRAYEIDRNLEYDEYHGTSASRVYNFFDTKTGSGAEEKELNVKELHKPVTKIFKKRNVYARFKDNIWAADWVVMESLSSKNKNVKYLYAFTKYAWVNLLKQKKVKQFLMHLSK